MYGSLRTVLVRAPRFCELASGRAMMMMTTTTKTYPVCALYGTGTVPVVLLLYR